MLFSIRTRQKGDSDWPEQDRAGVKGSANVGQDLGTT
jgi:hypothetical protein